MSASKQEIEARGQDVQSAIRNGLAQLGLTRDDVVVEVVDEGSRGLLGIGSRDAVVRLMPIAPSVPAEPTPVVAEPMRPAPTAVATQETAEQAGQEREPAETIPVPDSASGDEVAAKERGEPAPSEIEGEVAAEVVQALLDKMRVPATVEVRLAVPDDLTGKQIHVVEIMGDDLGALIGPRGETLTALQYISRLMVGHRLQQRADFIVDVEGYRQRREQALSRLAERMAKKVIRERRPISLEPMPPHERRVIHMTLRDSTSVYTQSTGEGKRRKVRILPR